LHFGTFDLKTHRGIIIETIEKLPSNQPIKNSPHCAFKTPDIKNSDKNNSNSNKNTPQNPVNQQHSNQQVEQSEQENFFKAFYQSTLESFLVEI
jgi:hypothetical protein